MRLIYADAVKKRADCYPPQIREVVANILRHTKTVDAVPVVRCRECIYYKDAEANIITEHDRVCTYALKHHFYRGPDEYCSKGERRKEEL